MTNDRSKMRWNGWGWSAQEAPAPGEAVWNWLAGRLGMPALLATPARALDSITLPASRLNSAQRQRLVDILGAERVREDAPERAFHALGRSYHDLLRLRDGVFAVPDAVLYPRGSDEVLALLGAAAEDGIAVVPFGGGTGVVGGVSASAGAFSALVTLDLSGMDRVLGIDAVAGTATAEAGITGPALEKNLQANGLTLGHLPQSFEFSTLGGWIAHAGTGQDSQRYGGARDWLAGARVATPQGWLKTGNFPASSAGPDLRALITGSEGAFGIVTEASVRVRVLPASSATCLYLFRDFASGIAVLRAAMREGPATSMMRLSDAGETRFHRDLAAFATGRGTASQLRDLWRDLRLKFNRFDDNAAALLVGFAGSAGDVASARRKFDALAAKLGARALGEGPAQSWHAMNLKAPYWRDLALDRGLGIEIFETAASWSKLPALYAAARGALDHVLRETAPRPGAHGIVLCHVSHSYPDGASLYFTVVFARALGQEIAQWRRIKEAASEAILAHGGTISHHHGVGEDHLPWMAREKGPLGIEILRAIKQAVDPKGILNPGKLIPPG